MTEIISDFECAISSDVACPDDIGQWPERDQKAALHAIDRFLSRYPGAVICDRKSYCMSADHPRFPAGNPGKFVLVYQITVDPPVEVADAA